MIHDTLDHIYQNSGTYSERMKALIGQKPASIGGAVTVPPAQPTAVSSSPLASSFLGSKCSSSRIGNRRVKHTQRQTLSDKVEYVIVEQRFFSKNADRFTTRFFPACSSAEKSWTKSADLSTMLALTVSEGKRSSQQIKIQGKQRSSDSVSSVKKLEFLTEGFISASEVESRAKIYPNITELVLQKPEDAAIAKLHLYKNLKTLVIDNAYLGESLESISQFYPQCKALPFFSDASLQQLAKCTKLKVLKLHNVETVNTSALKVLQQKLPNLLIKQKLNSLINPRPILNQ
jgi:hypothetical protein